MLKRALILLLLVSQGATAIQVCQSTIVNGGLYRASASKACETGRLCFLLINW